MSQYSTSKGPYGTVRYRKDGKLVAAKNVPGNILQVLEHNPVFNEEGPSDQRDRACIFCEAHSNLTRTVNSQVVSLCTDHYYSETIGKIVQQLRSRHESQESTES